MPRLAPLILTAVIAIAPLRPAIAQAPAEDLAALAARIAGPDAPPVERAGRLVAWINTEFAWTTTDYERRTVDDIIRRRGGNCAELSRVLARLLDLSGIEYRTVREINIQPESAQRQANAEERVRTAGLRMSVFGRAHNDHVWLEIADGGVAGSRPIRRWGPSAWRNGLPPGRRCAIAVRPPSPPPRASSRACSSPSPSSSSARRRTGARRTWCEGWTRLTAAGCRRCRRGAPGSSG
jgi:transglutaminase-like putative cysteine protease